MPMKVTAIVCCTAAPTESVMHGAPKLLYMIHHRFLHVHTQAKAIVHMLQQSLARHC